MQSNKASQPQGADEWQSRSHPIREDMAFQRREWAWQRLGWGLLLLFNLAAILGLFSNGLFSETTAVSADGSLEVVYQRSLRSGAAAELEIRLAAAPEGDSATETVSVAIGRDLVRALTFEDIRPRPAGSVATADGIRLTFRRDSGAPVRIGFSIRPHRIGWGAGEVRLPGQNRSVRLRFFVFP